MNTVFNPRTLEQLEIDHSFLERLPADPESENFRRQVHAACYSHVDPIAFPNARLLACSAEMAAELGLPPEECDSQRFVEVFSGSKPLDAMRPYAQCYGGHQFGNWAGQLGDGRAINLGEVAGQEGRHWILQLKGAGPTPYSRSADGLAVLRSSLREFVCSEAMHHLGVPTTRALSLIDSGEKVVRDMFYDGNPQQEPGAVVCRVAPSFLRFGSYEIFTSRGDGETLQRLADYTIEKDFPHLWPASGQPDRETYVAWFDEVCQRTARMIVDWMRVGFVHGVMNTDNMSILGLTIDYGPYGWLEGYDPMWTPNTTDAQGRRYRYGQQPEVALWNLVQLGNALYPLVEDVSPLEQSLHGYREAFEEQYRNMLLDKLGLAEYHSAGDDELTRDLLKALQVTETDMTLFFRNLADLDTTPDSPDQEQLLAPIREAFYQPELSPEQREKIAGWLQRYYQRLREEGRPIEERRAAMDAVNPLYVPRNYLAQLAIDDCAGGDTARLKEWMEVLKQPYQDQPGKEQFAAKRPEWARHRAGCSMLSCSS